MSANTKNLAYYGLSHWSKSLIWGYFNTFASFFAIYHLKIEPITVSLIVLLVGLADLFFDIPVSWVLTRNSSSGTPLRRWVAIYAPTCSLLFAAFFCFSANLFEAIPALLLVIFILFRFSFAFVDIPLNVAIARVTESKIHSNSLAATRSIGSDLSAVAIGVLTAFVLESEGKLVHDKIYLGAIVIAIAASIILVPSYTALERNSGRYTGAQGMPTSLPIFMVLRKMFGKEGRKAFRILFVINVVFLVGFPQMSHSLIFFSQSFVTGAPPLSTLVMLVTTSGVVTAFLWSKAASSVGKITTAQITLWLSTIAAMLFVFLSYHPLLALAFIVIFGAASHVNSHIWSLLADIVSNSQEVSASGSDVQQVAVFAAIGKLCITLSISLFSLLLGLCGYPEDPNTFALKLAIAAIMGLTAMVITPLFRMLGSSST